MRVTMRKTGRLLKCRIDGRRTSRKIYEVIDGTDSIPDGTDIVRVGCLGYNPNAFITKDYFVNECPAVTHCVEYDTWTVFGKPRIIA